MNNSMILLRIVHRNLCRSSIFFRPLGHCSARKFFLSERRDSLVFESNCRGIVRTYCNKRQAEMSSGSGDHAPVVAYEDLLEAQKDPAILIIDVREDAEIAETGKLPGSIHIPMGDVSHVLQTMNESEFSKKFEINKPSKHTKIIVSCRSGKRSAMVQNSLSSQGYDNIFNYSGGWLDWEEKQKSQQ